MYIFTAGNSSNKKPSSPKSKVRPINPLPLTPSAHQVNNPASLHHNPVIVNPRAYAPPASLHPSPHRAGKNIARLLADTEKEKDKDDLDRFTIEFFKLFEFVSKAPSNMEGILEAFRTMSLELEKRLEGLEGEGENGKNGEREG
jgi:hypothetical protein